MLLGERTSPPHDDVTLFGQHGDDRVAVNLLGPVGLCDLRGELVGGLAFGVERLGEEVQLNVAGRGHGQLDEISRCRARQ